MSKQKKSPRVKSPSASPASDKSPSGKKRNGHDKKEPKETTAAEAVVSPKKAEPAPQPEASSARPAETSSGVVGVRRRAEPTPAPKPAAKAPPRPTPQAAKPVAAAPVAKPSAATAQISHCNGVRGEGDGMVRSL